MLMCVVYSIKYKLLVMMMVNLCMRNKFTSLCYDIIKAVATEPVPVLQFSLWSAGIIEYVPITSVFYNIR